MQIPSTMSAMVLEEPGRPLIQKWLPVPRPSPQQVLVKVIACGVCRTDLHIADGDLDKPKLPLIPGHEIVGRVAGVGEEVAGLKEGDPVGIPWLGFTCGQCKYCLRGQENLCEQAGFTGYTLDGGFAQYAVAHHRFCLPLSDSQASPQGSPLLCAGLIGYRSYRMIPGHARAIGLYGFGAAAHILIQVAKFNKQSIFAFTRDGDEQAQSFAVKLGAAWAGDSSRMAPEKMDASIIFAPVGNLIPKALEGVDRGGTVVCGGIHMSDIPTFPYRLLWEERIVRSVANLTRNDGLEFLKLAGKIPIRTEIRQFTLQQANEALDRLRKGDIQGAAVLVMD
ncbi:MAG: zinc-dependent alcohol dehydrogenase family protein [Bacteroidota bacterium]|nr:zinc-dependent alcohol dehydrogenase family protein [Bacteroidota bacterium]MDP4215582.1 zinc-dependent alcohol dehydrogenase family protein [Bacteroidota bacterium]MDP4246204.1 zinc-dependent alcohol dehydrogenase family protein [Bacteroidota bacterium]MDP4255512.1 zinc-dependent alcohol dehydrogenase family protein [Bacteroidota bacterium]MDP4257773.1 zinc-dependent alcohol dehydrogenase family protein [Bacteroidota bacterium]